MSGLLRGLHNEEDPHYWSKGIVACTYSRDIPVIFRYLYHGQLWLSVSEIVWKSFVAQRKLLHHRQRAIGF